MDTATPEQPTTTPAPATQTPTAAPATSEPSAPAAASQRPTSMLQAFEQVAAAEDASTASPASAATVPAVQPTPSAVPEQAPPPEKWPTVLENARTKAISARDAQWMDKYGWATKVDEAAFSRVAKITNEIATNPIAHTVGMIRELFAHPTLSQQAKGAILQALGVSAGNGRTSQPQNFDPDVDIVDSNGRPTGEKTFTAARVQAIVDRAVAAAISKEVGPLKQDHQQRQQADRQRMQAAQQAETSKQAKARADEMLAEIQALFGDRKELWSELETMLTSNPRLSEHGAAIQIFNAKVLPTLQGHAKTEAIAHMKRSAAGNTANGTGVVAAPSDRPKNVNDLAKLLESLNGAQVAP